MKKSKISVVFTLFLSLIISLIFSFRGGAEELKWQTVEQTEKKSVSQILANLPEWDGVYIITSNGYIEFNDNNNCMQYKHVDIPNSRGEYWIDINDKTKMHVIPVEDFVGILVKGEDFLKRVRLFRTEKEPGCLFRRKTCDFYKLEIKLDFPFSLDKMRRKTISPGVYLFSPENPVSLFGTVEDNRYVAIGLINRAGFLIFGLQKGGSFGIK